MKIGLGILAVVLIVVLVMMSKNMKTPELGVEDGLFKPLSSKPNGVSTQTKDEDKLVEPLPFSKDLDSTKALIIEVCKSYGDVKIVKEERNYIHVVFTTGKMKYNDDAEFYFDENSQLVHYRSESRIGYSDMGLNRERYDALASSYNKLMEEN
ncbi:MAG: DUF1499 domain-containing protein [Clostridiales bacterium]|nr:DUF1499 domain-containing protein [Clostridiales bacterium]